MKKLGLVTLLVALLYATACTRDKEDNPGGNGNNNGEPTGLAAFLNGRFNVEAIDITGNVSAFDGFSAPLDSAGNGGSGFYDFDGSGQRVDYDVTGRVKFSLLAQDFNFPVPVNGSGDLEILSETRFSINPDDGSAPTVCDIVKAEGEELVFTTRSGQDTLGFNFDITLELFLRKD
jgi:hypothetical protein